MAKKKSTFGRPPKKPSERRHVRIVIKVTEAEDASIRKAADGKLTTWARDVLLREAGNQ